MSSFSFAICALLRWVGTDADLPRGQRKAMALVFWATGSSVDRKYPNYREMAIPGVASS